MSVNSLDSFTILLNEEMIELDLNFQ